MTVFDFLKMKKNGSRISMVACYDYWSARILDESKVDCLLVGDSVAMIVHGNSNTIPAQVEMMETHVRAVSRGAPNKFVIGDLPFLSVRKGLEKAVEAVDRVMKAGANAVKIEGVDGQEDILRHIVQSGVPVMGHIGLIPQSIHQLGGYRVQGRDQKQADDLMDQARRLQDAGCFSIVVECVKNDVAEKITRNLEIPTIGIGAGSKCDGQVLVLHDMLGLFKDIDPKFARKYVDGFRLFREAINCFDDDVKTGSFPSEEESFQ